jgi:uncharacterized membrane protein
MTRVLAVLVAVTLALIGCGGDDDSCPSLTDKQASKGDPIDGDTFQTFAGPFFATYCTRCHASTRTGDDRHGSPVNFNWDQEASVRMHLLEIRVAVGVEVFMPPSGKQPTCAERQRLVRWIDADAP